LASEISQKRRSELKSDVNDEQIKLQNVI